MLCCAAIGCTAGAAPEPGTGGPARIALRAARLPDPGSGVERRDVVVLVEGRRITAVLPAPQYRPRPGDHPIDLGAATLLPGLIDAHVHLAIGGAPRVNAVTVLRAGFTTVADLGAVSHRILTVRDSIAAGAWEGPRILAAGREAEGDGALDRWS
jgi:imidazolonepropionase-like amidohydrolase